MDPIVEAGAAAMIAGYLVAFYKLANPATAAWALVVVALTAGVASAFLIALAGGLVLNTQTGAETAIQGIVAAAIAAGLTRTDNAAEARRPDEGDPMHPGTPRFL